MKVSRLHSQELSLEAAMLLDRMCAFCEEWEGKVIEYSSRSERHKGLVIGHDGPRRTGDRITWGIEGFGGWGCVVIMKTLGVNHYIDPALVSDVREIRRDCPQYSVYEHEAVDLFCPYGCDSKGLLEWHPDWSGPEYEVFCPVHNREARSRAENLYHRPEGFDGSDPKAEAAYYDLTKIAYEQEAVAA